MSLAQGLRVAARRSVMLTRPTVQKVPKRFSGGDASPEELDKQIDKWIKISGFGCSLVAVGIIYGFATAHHGHPPEAIFPYMHLRHKRFPWGDGDRPFFGDTSIDVIARGGDAGHHH